VAFLEKKMRTVMMFVVMTADGEQKNCDQLYGDYA